MLLYKNHFDPPSVPFPLIAVDCETVLFEKESYGWKHKTRISPFRHPEMVLASFADSEGNCFVLGRDETATYLCERLLDHSYHFVFHASGFDIPVLCKLCPELLPLFSIAVEQGRVHDTRLLEPLIQIARGSRILSQKQLIAYPHLKDLALRRAGMTLDKDPNVRLGFGQFIHDTRTLPMNFLRYAAEDAEATIKVFCSQWYEAELYDDPSFCVSPRLPGHRARFGMLTEKVQVMGELALVWLSSFPIRIDLTQAEAIRARLAIEATALQAALKTHGFGWYRKKAGTFHLKFKPIQAALALFAGEQGFLPSLTPLTLKVSMKYEDWSPYKKDLPSPLTDWLRYMRLQKLLVTYIYPYSSSERHFPRYSVIGARTTRTSCATPNIQNVPKRKDGIRSLFIPEPGEVFLERDYSAAELIALAQVYRCLFGRSVLEDTLNSGVDPHDAQARRLVPAYDLLPDSEKKTLRQAAKAVNFGLPGGLGPRALAKYSRAAWGRSFTDEEAANLRTSALKADPELTLYLADRDDPETRCRLAASNIGCPLDTLLTAFEAWQDHEHTIPNYHWCLRRISLWKTKSYTPKNLDIPPGFNPKFDCFKQHVANPIGFVRGNCSFTEAHNTPFQSLVASGAKIALWNLYVWWQKDPTLFSPVAFVHDSILIRTTLDKLDRADRLLDVSMYSGLKAVCPDIAVKSDSTGALTRWGPSTDQLGGIIPCPTTTPTTPTLPEPPLSISSVPTVADTNSSTLPFKS